jgi:hypothetical protein
MVSENTSSKIKKYSNKFFFRNSKLFKYRPNQIIKHLEGLMFLVELPKAFWTLSIHILGLVNICWDMVGVSFGTTAVVRSFYVVCFNNEAQEPKFL